MVWDGPAIVPTDEAADAVRLSVADTDQAMQLAALTRPGPFGPHTIEMGEYFGCFVAGRLVAMTGERVHAPGLREVSGVCTHPEFQGRGLARRLVAKVVGRQLGRGETPVLHVMSANTAAVGLYESLGFRVWREGPVRVVTRVAAPV